MLYRTGNIEVETSNFHLSENGKSKAVEPQVFDLIVYLVTNRDRLVTRQEIFDKLWSGRIVSDTSLSNHIKSARKALGDDGQKQQFIKTVHGRGYQFIADVEEVVDKNESFNTPEIKADNDREKSIAVLAFTDLSPEKDQEYFSDGISEELLNLLTKWPDLKVISRTSSFSFKGKNETVENIGAALKVAHLLDGSVRKAGKQLRISVQLIKVNDGTYLWSETFNRELDDIFEIQDEVAKVVTEQLKITLLGENVKTQQTNSEAFNQYLLAKELFKKKTVDSLVKAKEVLNKSIAIDSSYAPSWVLLSEIILMDAFVYGAHQRDRDDAMLQIKEAIRKALSLDSNYAPAYAILADTNNLDWDFDSARINIDKAMSQAPTNPSILAKASRIMGILGKREESIKLMRKAIELDPLDSHHYYWLALELLTSLHLEEAYDCLQKCLYFNPETSIAHNVMSLLLNRKGEFQEALEEAGKEPSSFWREFSSIVALYALKRSQDADQLLTKYIHKYGETDPDNIAAIYAEIGDRDNTFKWLNKAYEKRAHTLVAIIKYPSFKLLYNDSRWKDFLCNLNLPDDHWLIESLDEPCQDKGGSRH